MSHINVRDGISSLSGIIIGHIKSKNIDIRDGKRVMEEAPEIWRVLCESGKMPKFITYENLVDGIIKIWFRGEQQ